MRLIDAVDLWHKYSLADLVTPYFDPVETPLNGYDRLGIRSHGKGTFHSHVAKGNELETAKMSRVASNKLIVNITFAWEHAVAITTEKDANKLVSHRFPQFSINENLISPGFFKYMILDEKFRRHLELSSPGGAGRNRVLKTEEMLKFEMTVPSIDEQKRIELFLDVISKTINQEQQKIEALQKYKRGLLQAMFPANGDTVPKVRFPGFTGAWEQRKLSDTFDFLQNNTLSRADLNAETGFAKNVHYGDVLIKFSEYLDASSTALPYIPSQQIVDKYKGSMLQDGDVVMADTAEDESVGKCTEIAGLQGFPTISGLHTIPLRPKEKFAPGYLGYYMNSGSYHDQLSPLMQGIKVTSVSKSAISNTNISYPVNSDEQAEIGGFFIQLDKVITLYQNKYDSLKKYKAGLLQHMFI